MVDELACFVVAANYDQLSEEARVQAKIRVLDALGCAIGALASPVIGMITAQNDDFGGNPCCTLIGGDRLPPTVRHFITVPWCASWILMTATLPKEKPAIRATTLGQCWQPVNMPMGLAGIF